MSIGGQHREVVGQTRPIRGSERWSLVNSGIPMAFGGQSRQLEFSTSSGIFTWTIFIKFCLVLKLIYGYLHLLHRLLII